MAFTVKVDFSRCQSNGVCVNVAPKLFQMDDEDRLSIVEASPSDEFLAAAREAAALCPTRAITIVDEGSKA